jgi:hypothetical protein
MTTDAPQLGTAVSDIRVWRVGYRPEPWAWPSWQYATDGRFPGRWDDADGNFRTIYAGSHLLSCLLEVPASFRPDPDLATQLSAIIDDELTGEHPTSPAGTVPRSWLHPRTAASAMLTGAYASVTNAESIAVLRPDFLHRAHVLGLNDFDAAALKDARPRALTQEVATHIYETIDLDGVHSSPATGTTMSYGPSSNARATPTSAPAFGTRYPRSSLQRRRKSTKPSASTTSPGPTNSPQSATTRPKTRPDRATHDRRTENRLPRVRRPITRRHAINLPSANAHTGSET